MNGCVMAIIANVIVVIAIFAFLFFLVSCI